MSRTYRHCLDCKKGLIPAHTDIFRVIDGEGDGRPDVFADQMGDRVLVSTRDCPIPTDLERELRELGMPVFHKKLEQNQKEAPVQIAGPELPLQFTVTEQGVRFKIDMSTGYSQGIFLDQRDHRRQVRERSRPGMRVLNTFAYTGAFSVYAAQGGTGNQNPRAHADDEADGKAVQFGKESRHGGRKKGERRFRLPT